MNQNLDERAVNGLGVLAAIVRCGSFASAGKALNMSQSGVSRSIARLEARLGLRLFERTTRSVSMTDEGRRLYEQIGPLLTGLEEAVASVMEGRALVRGRLRVQMHRTFAHFLEGARLRAFLESHPELELELITRDQLGDLVSEGFDVAIHVGNPPVSSLVVRKLWTTRIVTVAAPSYFKRHKHPATPQELVTDRHILIDYRDPETGRPFEWEFHRGRRIVKVPTNGHIIVSDIITMHNLCLAGYGIVQVMENAVSRLLNQGKLIDLFPDWQDERFPLYAVYPSRKHLPAKTRAFLDFVLSLPSSIAANAQD
ncbi:LysR family transcriptional regulator [Alloacidobacterium dinghuense]|uniref:LysR family transcriptional regulator n=1 Tax=Alloacidobacterium dinghuense TaxID=2763107 RepID=A0A7G8BGM6_9BACT|nr:LysR family transcriptional regulator [Alloacidobacterium dinghuense]QNI31696.1 LysR family transcriptional regulator [Alloacidobacterium dinghuense]